MKKGQALIEVLVGLGIAAAIMPAVVTAFFAARGGEAQEQVRVMALARLREGREVLRLLKEDNWANLADNGTYRLTLTGGAWSISPGTETDLDGLFTRQIVVSDSYRDVNGLLSLTGILDPSVKHIELTVSWTTPIASFVRADYYLMRFENRTWLQTLVSDFTPGVQSGTTITDTGGGEIILASGGQALSDWCEPALTLSSIDLPKSGVANAISADVGAGTSPNQVIAGTGDNASGVSLAYAEIVNANPPSGQVLGTFDSYKTNGVFVGGDRAYLATDDAQEDIVIVDLTNRDPVTGKYAKLGAFNAPANGPKNAAGIYVSGNLGFMTIGDKLHTFDVTTRTPLGSITLAGDAQRLVVFGSYAYVAENSGERALEIVQFSQDGTTLSLPGWTNLPGQNGVDIVVNSTASRGYLATSQGNVYIVNTSAPYSGALPAPLGVYSTAGMTPKGVAVVTHNKAIVVGTGGSLQYQVFDLSEESTPVSCGGLNIATGVNGIASVQEEDGDTFSYIITGDAGAELKIIQGGGGGGGGVYTLAGTFESDLFDAGSSVMFNRFDVSSAVPVDTALEYQVAITAPSAGSCAGASYTFVGPDKQPSSFFTDSSALPLGSGVGYTNPGQCLKYRAYLRTSNSNNTPVMSAIIFNYSP